MKTHLQMEAAPGGRAYGFEPLDDLTSEIVLFPGTLDYLRSQSCQIEAPQHGLATSVSPTPRALEADFLPVGNSQENFERFDRQLSI